MRNARQKSSFAGVDEALVLGGGMSAHRQGEGGIGNPTVEAHREVKGEQVALLQGVVVRESVKGCVIDRGAEHLAKGRPTKGGVIIDITTVRSHVFDHLVGESIELQKIDAR